MTQKTKNISREQLILRWKLLAKTFFVAEDAAKEKLNELLSHKEKMEIEDYASEYLRIIAEEIVDKGAKL